MKNDVRKFAVKVLIKSLITTVKYWKLVTWKCFSLPVLYIKNFAHIIFIINKKQLTEQQPKPVNVYLYIDQRVGSKRWYKCGI